MALEARIRRINPDDGVRHCEYNSMDSKPADYVFTHPDGKDHFVCESHKTQHMKRDPDIWADLALRLSLQA